MATSFTTTSVSMTSAESNFELYFSASIGSFDRPRFPSAWKHEITSSSTMLQCQRSCEEEGRETRAGERSVGPPSRGGPGARRNSARGARASCECEAAVVDRGTALQSLQVTFNAIVTSTKTNSTSTSYITHQGTCGAEESTTALALFPNPDIDGRKALNGCLPSGNGREECEELVEQRHALHSAGGTRGQDEACWRRLELPQEVFEDSSTVCTLEQDVPLSMDQVNSPSPSIDKPYTTCLDGPISTPLEVEHVHDSAFQDNDLLRKLQRDRRNIVLDSPRPDLAPHIVITPPDRPYEGYWAYLINTVNAQSYSSLAIPPRVYGDGEYVWPPMEDSHFSWHLGQYVRPYHYTTSTEPYAGGLQTSDSEGPWRVFSRSRFQMSIELASEERLLMHHVISALHRINFKAVAMLTCAVAPSFRERWDTPGFVEKFEKPFHWTDPADSLLAEHIRNPSCIIIDSEQPFTVPHIVIEEAPPEDPYQACANHTVSPQDYNFGFYLTVPASQVEFVNVCSPAEEDENDYALDGYGTAYISWDSESEPDSPEEPCTPESDPFHDPEDLGCTGSSDSQHADTGLGSSNDKFDLPPPAVDSYDIHVTLVDDEDEDDLPPFDDWYLSIAQRAAPSEAV